ncbi:MAG: DUF5916 domain-containing protein [Cellulophaga sp.]
MKTSLYTFLFLFSAITIAQENGTKKSLTASRVTKAPKIDGILDELVWKNAESAANFLMFRPDRGIKERKNKKTVVKVLYDDQAIYFGVYLYDDNPQGMAMQFGGRDEVGQVDYFQVSINPNNDGQNDTDFLVMSTGAQADAKAKTSGRRSFGKDYSWSAVWESNISIVDDGWIVEIRIPYSALRFSNTNIQTWGINFQRKMNKENEEYSWNFIDTNKGKIPQYAGTLLGIENIEPPTRLSFSPYASATSTSFDGSNEINASIGMDLKYGINESFTLDATLIPDFGQTAFDDQILNLGPFEQRYTEKRAFFTEGTELFEKGGIFYSRRVGNRAVGYRNASDNLTENETVIENPTKVNLINALKVSGRTKKGLGIGIFNAITEKTYATIKDSETEETRKVLTEPFANYNVFVLDQQFNGNSSVSIVNTNVTRDGSFRNANTTALLFNLSDKGNKFNISGSYKLSNVFENEENTKGYSAFLSLGKTSGNWRYSLVHFRNNDTYDIRDLGFQRSNNKANYFSRVSYQILKPTKLFNRYRISFKSELKHQTTPEMYTGNEFELDAFFSTVNKTAFSISIETGFGDQLDVYEPRVAGRYFRQNSATELSGFISTDYRKKLAFDIRGAYAKRSNTDNVEFAINFSPRYRISDKFEIVYKAELERTFNEKGRVTQLDDETIIFGNRDKKQFTNSLAGKYSFNTKSSLSLSFRHYWSPVTYDADYLSLNDNGTLDANNYKENNNINYNIWNLDFNYAWQFAPGSQLIALYRNTLFNKNDLSQLDYSNNLEDLFKEPLQHIFSLKMIYYIDYNNIKNVFTARS